MASAPPTVDDVLLLEKGVIETAVTRLLWLGGLLLIQSVSSIVLSFYKEVLQQQLVVTLFLTMLVGAGGNAGAQAAVSVIKGLAVGKITRANVARTILRECTVGVILALGVFFIGFGRVMLTTGDHTDLKSWLEGLTVGISVSIIVVIAAVLGSLLPLTFHFVFNVDASHSSATIQVLMDIIGVTITCQLASMMLPTSLSPSTIPT